MRSSTWWVIIISISAARTPLDPQARSEFTCAGCGYDHGRTCWRTKGWQIMCCRRCGLLRTWPVPSQAALARIYEDPGYHRTRSDSDGRAWTARARQIVATLPDAPRTLLDFGAGQGHLVRAFRDLGICAVGVEPSPAAREIANRWHDIQLDDTIGALPDGYFTTVVLLHVLEHVHDPSQTLRDIRAKLTLHGTLFIEVPHAGSVDMCNAEMRRRILDVPVHLHHFTPKTLTPIVNDAGFAIIDSHLFNASPVEAMITRCSRRRNKSYRLAELAESPEWAEGERRGTSDVEALLRVVRRFLPGRKFQLIGQARNP